MSEGNPWGLSFMRMFDTWRSTTRCRRRCAPASPTRRASTRRRPIRAAAAPLPLGILAFGSLIQDPGPEIEPQIRLRIDTETGFPVEAARLSNKRAGAPTLAPHPDGAPVKAQRLVLADALSVAAAEDLLWRRETGTQDPTESYSASTTAHSIRVGQTSHPSVATVLYTVPAAYQVHSGRRRCSARSRRRCTSAAAGR